MRLDEAVSQYHLATYYLTPSTSRWYTSKLRAFVVWAASEGVTELEHVTAPLIRRYLKEQQEIPSLYTSKPRSSYTNHGYAQVIKGFLNWCEREGLIAEEVARRIASPRVEKKVIEVLSPAQVKLLFAACAREKTPALVARDIAILSVLLDTGVRASELCNLALDNVHFKSNEAYLKVLGKGHKEREVGLGDIARTNLRRYICHHRDARDGDKHVFVGRFHKPLTPSGLLQIIERLGIWAGIQGVRCTPHTFRHTYAMRYIEDSGDIYKLKLLMGHCDVSVTERYLRAYQARNARKGRSVLDCLG